MSVRVMAEVWDAALDPNLKLVLLAYADHANDDGSQVYPGEERMAAKTGYSLTSIRRLTADLVRLGLLVQVARGHRGQRASYRVAVEIVKGYQVGRHSKPLTGDAKASHLDGESLPSEGGKPLTGDTPNHPEPPVTTLEPSLVSAGRKRDHLWDSFVEVHGDPATKSERGKYNAVVKKLRAAKVGPAEYPELVAAFASKNNGLQPAPATVAERVGELRHYLARGPIQVIDAEDFAGRRRSLEMQRQYDADVASGKVLPK